jgi:hypothetical protein
MVRLKSGHGRAMELVEKSAVLEVDLVFDSPHVLARSLILPWTPIGVGKPAYRPVCGPRYF